MADIQERKKHWTDLYAGSRRTVILVHYGLADKPLPYPENNEKRVEWALEKYRTQLCALEWLNDDAIPHLDPYTGTEIFAHAFGCRVHYPGTDMPFALPLIKSVNEFNAIKRPRLEDSTLTEVFEIADKLRASYPDALMRLPDIQSPFDIVALIWEKADFFAALYEEPEAVKELIAMVYELLTAFLDTWYARYGKEFIAHFPDYYMPYGITLSEDESGAISPEMFKEYSLDTLSKLSDRYGMLGMHCCANAGHQWDNFKSLHKLSLINICQPTDIIREAYTFFKDVCAQMHPIIPFEQINTGARVVLKANAADRDEAVIKYHALEELSKGFGCGTLPA